MKRAPHHQTQLCVVDTPHWWETSQREFKDLTVSLLIHAYIKLTKHYGKREMTKPSASVDFFFLASFPVYSTYICMQLVCKQVFLWGTFCEGETGDNETKGQPNSDLHCLSGFSINTISSAKASELGPFMIMVNFSNNHSL